MLAPLCVLASLACSSGHDQKITAATRAAHRLVASGQATLFRIKQPGPEAGRGNAYQILARPGTITQSGLLDEPADASLADRARMRFEPTVVAHDLATLVEMLSAAIQAIPTDRLDSADAEGLVASFDASLEALRWIRRHLRRSIRSTAVNRA